MCQFVRRKYGFVGTNDQSKNRNQTARKTDDLLG